ncbi:MAG TPA: hypothetical protein P5137_00380 [Candidatus Brocadiia bacterium]|nr:hypothetical protein [Candidatus Brocadiia bacterium]
MRRTSLAAGLLALCLGAAALAAKPVAIIAETSRSAAGAEALALADFGLKDALVAFEVKPSLSPAGFKKYAAVVIPTLDRDAKPWSDEEVKSALAYVREGGVIVFIGNGASRVAGAGRDLKRIEPLTGCLATADAKGEGKILAKDHPIFAGFDAGEGKWAEMSGAFARLTTAQALVGAGEGKDIRALVAVNNAGKGRVFLFAKESFRMLSVEGSEATRYIDLITRAVLTADPARTPPPKERWIPIPLGK